MMILKNPPLQNRSRPISTKLSRKNIYVKKIHICLNEGPELLSKGDKSENALTNENNSSETALLIQYVKSLVLLQNHWSNFNQTWYKACSTDGLVTFSWRYNY